MIARDRVTATIQVGVDPRTAFEVFTAEIASWWQGNRDLGTGATPPRGVMRFEPGVGGRLLETYADAPDDPFEVGRVRVWVPPERLIFEWRQGNFTPEQSTEVEVRFEARDGGTQVTVEHRGFAALPLDHGTRHGFGDGPAFTRMWTDHWQGLLAAFVARLARHREGSQG